MEFQTERLILRPWKESDAESLYKYAKNPEVGPIAGWPVHTSVENSLEIIQTVLSAPETYAVCLKEDNQAIGSVGLFTSSASHTDAKQDEMEIGYWIGVPFWGKGYIPEAVYEMQRHAFEDLGCRGMWCGYYDQNVKSKRCQEKCGFTFHHTVENQPCPLMGDVRTENFTYLTKQDWELKIKKKESVVLYVHGKGGNANEAEHYKPLFSDCDVIGLDYQTFTPWETGEEIKKEVKALRKRYQKIVLIANSIGAFFSMNADIETDICQAYFISPVVDMEKLIRNMMCWANVTEEELQKKGSIETTFGETLSWQYLTYVRDNKRSWKVKTYILYGSTDNLTSLETITAFAEKNQAGLTVMEGGEHWFHTKEQMEFLDHWIKCKSDKYENGMR